jgi:hypothetical protein
VTLLFTLALLAGLLLVSAGAWMAYQPAGLIVAGTCLICSAVFYVRGGAE